MLSQISQYPVKVEVIFIDILEIKDNQSQEIYSITLLENDRTNTLARYQSSKSLVLNHFQWLLLLPFLDLINMNLTGTMDPD